MNNITTSNISNTQYQKYVDMIPDCSKYLKGGNYMSKNPSTTSTTGTTRSTGDDYYSIFAGCQAVADSVPSLPSTNGDDYGGDDYDDYDDYIDYEELDELLGS